VGIRKKAAEGGGNFAAENGFAPGKVAEEGGREGGRRRWSEGGRKKKYVGEADNTKDFG